MKHNDIEIIRRLRDGRKLNISRIARELNMPITTVADRIKAIERKYMIKRLSLLDYPNLGLNGIANVAIKIPQEQKNAFLAFIKDENCVNSIYHINSDHDYMVELVCKDFVEIKEWVTKAKENFNVSTDVYHVLKIEEKEKFKP